MSPSARDEENARHKLAAAPGHAIEKLTSEVLIATIGVIVAIGLLAAFAPWYSAVILAAVAIAGFVAYLIESRAPSRRGATNTARVPATPRWQSSGILIGCRIGRRSISVGALKIGAGDSFPASRDFEIVMDTVVRQIDDAENQQARLTEAVEAIVGMARRAQRDHFAIPIEGIGIAIPGHIPTSGEAGLPELLPTGADISREIETKIRNGDREDSRREAQRLAGICYLDNDIRCAARHVKARYREDPFFNNFACLHIGTGVGAAFVFDQSLYYGAHLRAGEIGHIDLSAGPALKIKIGDRKVPPMTCGCKVFGYHYEALVSYQGLAALGRRGLGQSRYLGLVEKAGCATDEVTFEHNWWPAIVGSIGSATDLNEEVRNYVNTRREVADALAEILDSYIEILVGSLSMFTTILDLDHVVLLGSLVERLRMQSEFHTRIARALNNAKISHVFGGEEEIWKGAALLARDPEYLALKNLRSPEHAQR